jgi:FtsP/CotA-like multicopper oxidase with cupredoxin domain
MDGVPGLSFPGIAAGQTFTYTIPLKQSGTYWYHSHSGFQEQTGHYGALIIEPLSRQHPLLIMFPRIVIGSQYTLGAPTFSFKRKETVEGANVQYRFPGQIIGKRHVRQFQRSVLNSRGNDAVAQVYGVNPRPRHRSPTQVFDVRRTFLAGERLKLSA